MLVVSQGLASYPDLRIDGFDWQVTDAPEPSVGSSAKGQRRRGAGSRQGRFHQALIRGSVEPFDGDYREALELVRGFADTLGKMKGVYQVSILELPLDVGPGSNLSGDTGADSAPKQANFSLRLVMTGEPATS